MLEDAADLSKDFDELLNVNFGCFFETDLAIDAVIAEAEIRRRGDARLRDITVKRSQLRECITVE